MSLKLVKMGSSQSKEVDFIDWARWDNNGLSSLSKQAYPKISLFSWKITHDELLLVASS